jgi:hypothetical protein
MWCARRQRKSLVQAPQDPGLESHVLGAGR